MLLYRTKCKSEAIYPYYLSAQGAKTLGKLMSVEKSDGDEENEDIENLAVMQQLRQIAQEMRAQKILFFVK
jgi:hypothetical protein